MRSGSAGERGRGQGGRTVRPGDTRAHTDAIPRLGTARLSPAVHRPLQRPPPGATCSLERHRTARARPRRPVLGADDLAQPSGQRRHLQPALRRRRSALKFPSRHSIYT